LFFGNLPKGNTHPLLDDTRLMIVVTPGTFTPFDSGKYNPAP
jgi:hypothetical protein